MGRRRIPRTKMVMPVRVWGMNSLGKPFTQLAHTLDITANGALLAGFHSQLNLDEIIAIQCRHRKARFRVAWIGRPIAAGDTHVGVQCLEGEKDIWGLDLPKPEAPDNYEARPRTPDRRHERRIYPRFAVAGGVEVRRPFADAGLWAQISDVSLTGCYVQTATPLRVQSPLRLLVKVSDIELDFRGVVRTCHEHVGMGVEFTEPGSQADAVRLRFLLQRLMKGELQPIVTAASPDATSVANRLQTLNNQLRELEEVLKSVEVDARVLRQFREALGHARNTAWAVQRWIELYVNRDDAFAVHRYLNRERIRLATELCRTLCKDIRVTEPDLPPSELEGLLESLEDLFTQLAAFSVPGTAQAAAPPPSLEEKEEKEERELEAALPAAPPEPAVESAPEAAAAAAEPAGAQASEPASTSEEPAA